MWDIVNHRMIQDNFEAHCVVLECCVGESGIRSSFNKRSDICLIFLNGEQLLEVSMVIIGDALEDRLRFSISRIRHCTRRDRRSSSLT